MSWNSHKNTWWFSLEPKFGVPFIIHNLEKPTFGANWNKFIIFLFNNLINHTKSWRNIIWWVIEIIKICAALRCPIRALSEATANPTANPVTPNKEGGEESPPNWKIKMLYDGDCPLCMREVYLQELVRVLAFHFSLYVTCLLNSLSRKFVILIFWLCFTSLYCQVNMLRERNERYGTIKFVDISSDDYSPEENQGLDYKTVR